MNNEATSERCSVDTKAPSILDSLSQKMIFRLLGAMQFGQIVVIDGENRWTFGSDETLTAQVTIRDPSFYHQVVFGGSIGVGEAYIGHLWDVDDLSVLSRIMVLNMDLLDRMERGLGSILQIFRLLGHVTRHNSRKRSKRNIIAHYDLGNTLYKSFLDPTMMYSAAIYPKESISVVHIVANRPRNAVDGVGE